MMEFKSGTYAIYHGKEFKLNMDPDSVATYILTSNDPASLQAGFIRWPEFGQYKKTITLDQLEYAYDYQTYAIYQGLTFEVDIIRDNMATLIHSGLEGSDQVVDLGFKFIDRWWFSKKVAVEEVEAYRTVTIPMDDFPMPPGHQGE